MGSNVVGPTNEWGDIFVMEFSNAWIEDEFLEELRKSPFYKTEYDPTKQMTHVVLQIPEGYRDTVVKPFLAGKYSKIDRDYVRRYYEPKRRNVAGIYEDSYNYKILTKHPEIRDWWEYRLGTSLPEDAEVWPKPEKEDEIFMYVNEESRTSGSEGERKSESMEKSETE